MSEKRFVIVEIPYDDFIINDTVEDKEIYNNGIVDLLNEQQATIQQLQREIEEWKKENRELLDQIQEFERIPKSIRELWVE